MISRSVLQHAINCLRDSKQSWQHLHLLRSTSENWKRSDHCQRIRLLPKIKTKKKKLKRNERKVPLLMAPRRSDHRVKRKSKSIRIGLYYNLIFRSPKKSLIAPTHLKFAHHQEKPTNSSYLSSPFQNNIPTSLFSKFGFTDRQEPPQTSSSSKSRPNILKINSPPPKSRRFCITKISVIDNF